MIFHHFPDFTQKNNSIIFTSLSFVFPSFCHHFPSNPWILYTPGVGSGRLVLGALGPHGDALPADPGRADEHGDPRDARNGADGHVAKPGDGRRLWRF